MTERSMTERRIYFAYGVAVGIVLSVIFSLFSYEPQRVDWYPYPDGPCKDADFQTLTWVSCPHPDHRLTIEGNEKMCRCPEAPES